jgi:hypothetical protein
MDFDVKKYKEENDRVALNELQKRALISRAKHTAEHREDFSLRTRVAAAGFALLVLGGGIWVGNKLFAGKANVFTVTAYAASTDDKSVTMDNEFKPVGELKSLGGGEVYVYDDDNSEKLTQNYIFRKIEFSFGCEGNNVKSVTYTAHNAAFKIIDKSGIISTEKSDFLKNTMLESSVWREPYSEFTVEGDYLNKRIGDEPNVCLVSKIDLLSKECPQELKKNHPADFATKKEAEQYYNLKAQCAVKGVSIDVTATFADGSRLTKTLVFNSEAEITDWATEADGSPMYDTKTTVRARVIE